MVNERQTRWTKSLERFVRKFLDQQPKPHMGVVERLNVTNYPVIENELKFEEVISGEVEFDDGMYANQFLPNEKTMGQWAGGRLPDEDELYWLEAKITGRLTDPFQYFRSRLFRNISASSRGDMIEDTRNMGIVFETIEREKIIVGKTGSGEALIGSDTVFPGSMEVTLWKVIVEKRTAFLQDEAHHKQVVHDITIRLLDIAENITISKNENMLWLNEHDVFEVGDIVFVFPVNRNQYFVHRLRRNI